MHPFSCNPGVWLLKLSFGMNFWFQIKRVELLRCILFCTVLKPILWQSGCVTARRDPKVCLVFVFLHLCLCMCVLCICILYFCTVLRTHSLAIRVCGCSGSPRGWRDPERIKAMAIAPFLVINPVLVRNVFSCQPLWKHGSETQSFGC